MTEIDTEEYCEDCGTAVSYDDEGNPECECEWEEVGEPLSQEEYAELCKAEGREWRHWHPDYMELRGQSHGYRWDSPSRFVKKATLGHPLRIERLRWQSCLNWWAIQQRLWEFECMIADTTKEFFVAHDEADEAALQKRIKRAEENDRIDPLSEEEIARRRLPSHYHCERSDRGGISCGWSTDYWTYQPPEHKGTDMEVIAAAAHLGEWEQEILPDRLKRAKDPKLLALGETFRHLTRRQRTIEKRNSLLAELLEYSILNLDVLPKGRDYVEDHVRVDLNGRLYSFIVGPHEGRRAERDRWPDPRRPDTVVVVENYGLDEKLIGCRPDAVACRLGPPTREEGKKWIYPEGTVVFDKEEGYYHQRVAEVIKSEEA